MAEPSRTTLAGWEPRNCCYCQCRITHSGKNAVGAAYALSVDAEGRQYNARAWHPDCKPKRVFGQHVLDIRQGP